LHENSCALHQQCGAGLRIEYKFINQLKQRIEKSLTNQKISAPQIWCRLAH
jgi:hypothetical protein